jgi:hypothetical protein
MTIFRLLYSNIYTLILFNNHPAQHGLKKLSKLRQKRQNFFCIKKSHKRQFSKKNEKKCEKKWKKAHFYKTISEKGKKAKTQ